MTAKGPKPIELSVWEVIKFATTPKKRDEFLEHFHVSGAVVDRNLEHDASQGILVRNGPKRGPGIAWVSAWHHKDDCRIEEHTPTKGRKPWGPIIVSRFRTPKTASQVCVESGIPIAALYRSIRELQSLGFIQEVDRILTKMGKRQRVFLSTVQYQKNRLLDRVLEEKAANPHAIQAMMVDKPSPAADIDTILRYANVHNSMGE